MRVSFIVIVSFLAHCSSSVPIYLDGDVVADTRPDTEEDGDTEEIIEYQQTACWTVSGTDNGEIALLEIDMESGNWTELERYGNNLYELRVTGLIYFDYSLVMIGHSGDFYGWIVVDAISEEVETIYPSIFVPPISTYRDNIIHRCEEMLEFCLFESVDTLVERRPSEHLDFGGGFWNTLAVHNDEAFVLENTSDGPRGWSTGVYSLIDGNHIRSFGLEENDLGPWPADGGLSYAGGRLYLLDDPRRQVSDGRVRITAYNPNSGFVLDVVELVDLPYPIVQSLWCESPGPELP